MNRRLYRLVLSLSWAGLVAPAGAEPLAIAYPLSADTPVHESFDALGPDGTRAPGLPDGQGGWDSYWSLRLGSLKPDERYDGLALPEGAEVAAYNGGVIGGVDRAIGLYAADGGNPRRQLTVRVRNAGDSPLPGFHLRFDVEVWMQRAADHWAGLQAFVSLDGADFVDLGDAFEVTHLNTGHDGFPGWVDGNAPQNSYRDVGGHVDLAALGLPAVAPGADVYLLFDGSKGVGVPDGAKRQANRHNAAFLDELRVSVQPWDEPVQSAGPPVVPALPPFAAGMLALGFVAGARRGLRT